MTGLQHLQTQPCMQQITFLHKWCVAPFYPTWVSTLNQTMCCAADTDTGCVQTIFSTNSPALQPLHNAYIRKQDGTVYKKEPQCIVYRGTEAFEASSDKIASYRVKICLYDTEAYLA